jgi:hypothetical protein
MVVRRSLFRCDARFFRLLGSRSRGSAVLVEDLTAQDGIPRCGAHHGVYSIVAAKKLGHRGTVVAFEPSPTEYRGLRLQVRQNRLSSVRTEPLALGSAASARPFFRIAPGHTTQGG